MNQKNFINEKMLHWTPSAVDCYERGCICEGCPIFLIIETECVMKITVLELVKTLGKPPEKVEIDINEIEQKLIEGRTLYEIAKELGISPAILQKITKSSGISALNYINKRERKRKNKK